MTALHPPVHVVPGDGDTVRCASIYPLHEDRAAAGSVARYVFDLLTGTVLAGSYPRGQRHPGSGHDLDQRQEWLDRELLPMAYSPAAVANMANATFEL